MHCETTLQRFCVHIDFVRLLFNILQVFFNCEFVPIFFFFKSILLSSMYSNFIPRFQNLFNQKSFPKPNFLQIFQVRFFTNYSSEIFYKLFK